MSTENKFEETYGFQKQEKATIHTANQGKQKVPPHADRTRAQTFGLGRLIFIILLLATAVFVGGIFSLVVIGFIAATTIISFIFRLFLGGPGGTVSRRY